MRSQKWMMWSGGAATLVFLIAQFFAVRSLGVNLGNSSSDTRAHVLFTTSTTTGIAAPVQTVGVDPWRAMVAVLAVGLLIAGLVIAERRSPPGGPGPVLAAGGAASLVSLAIAVLSAPFPTDFGWFAYAPAEAFASNVSINFESDLLGNLDVGFFLVAACAVCAVVCVVAAAVLSAGPPRPSPAVEPAPSVDHG